MTPREATEWILMLYRRIDPAEPYAPMVSEAVSLAIHALIEQYNLNRI